MRVLNQAFGQPMGLEERAADPLAGGLQNGYQCGMLWGAALAAGAQAYRLYGAGPQSEARAIVAAQRVVETFRAQNKAIDCSDITDIDMSNPTMRMVIHFLVKTGTKGTCFGMAARYASAAFSEINASLSAKTVEALAAPLSCAAVLARKMGASEMHQVMAAGFAGGIGLSGDACGALGAAIWIRGMNFIKEGGTVSFKTPYAAAAIERFLESSDYEFECAKIVGRKFENAGDHAAYVRQGGCSKIIEALAAE